MGWASGFQAGTQMARSWLDTYRDAEQRRKFEEIQQAKPEQGLGYTAEQGQELQNIATAINPETGQPYYQVQAAPGGLGYQVQPNFQVEGQQAAPVSYAPGQVTDFLGRRTAGGLTPQQESAARYSAYADVIARSNPMEANRMRRELAAEERAQQEFQTGQELRGLQLRQGQRAEQADMNLERAGTDIAAFVQQNGRAPGMAEIRDIAAKNNLTLDQQFKLGSNLTGIAEADAKLTASEIQKKIKGKGLDGLLALHKDDPLFDDNSFFEKSVGKDGKITLTQRSKDGAVLGRSTFADSAEATAYLTQQATDPGNVFSWMQASRLNAARIGASEASAAKDYAAADYYREGRGKAAPKKEVSNKDLMDFVKEYGDTVVGQGADRKPIRLRDLPPAEQRNRAIEFYTGQAEGGLPDIAGKDGIKLSKEEKKAAPPAPAGGLARNSEAEETAMFADARRGGEAGLNYVRSRLAANDFNLRQRLEAEKILGLR